MKTENYPDKNITERLGKIIERIHITLLHNRRYIDGGRQ